MKLFRQLRDDPRSWFINAFPICKWLPKYRASDIPYDFVAGLTVGLTLLPISLAYAQMAFLRPEYGLYSSYLAQFLYIFLGTSKDAIIGPSAINCMLLAQFNAQNPLYMFGDNTYANILALSNGIVFLLIGVLKFGFIVNLFSIPVVCGFTSASAFAISASQLRTLVGIKHGVYDSPGVFVKQLKNLYDYRHEIKRVDVIFGLTSIGFLLVFEYSHKVFLKMLKRCRQPETERGKKVRETLLNILRLLVASRNCMVFIAATGTAYYLYTRYPGIKEELTVVGYIKPGFPAPSFPSFYVINSTRVLFVDNATNSSNWVEQEIVVQTPMQVFSGIGVGFMIMPIMGMMELFAILKALARKNGYRIDPTQEFMAVGLGNFLQSFLSAFPVTAATAKSALNDQCRVRSQLSTLVSIVIILVAIGCLSEVFFYVPKAALSAILITSAHHLFDYKAAIKIWREYKPDFFIFLLTFLLCLFYDLAYGILIAILVNMLTFLRPVIRMQLSVSKEPIRNGNLDSNDHVTVVQLSHGLKYPSVDKFIDKMAFILSSSGVHIILDCRFLSSFDFTGFQAWHMLLRMAYNNKKHIIFTNLSETARSQLESIGLEHFNYAYDVDTAIAEFSAVATHLNPELANIRRLRQTISVISHSTPPRRMSEAIFRQASSQGSPLMTLTAPSQNEAIIAESADDLRVQEARLMKLMESTAPKLYNELPIAVGNVDSNREGSSSTSEGKSSNGNVFSNDDTKLSTKHLRMNRSDSVYSENHIYALVELDETKEKALQKEVSTQTSFSN